MSNTIILYNDTTNSGSSRDQICTHTKWGKRHWHALKSSIPHDMTFNPIFFFFIIPSIHKGSSIYKMLAAILFKMVSVWIYYVPWAISFAYIVVKLFSGVFFGSKLRSDKKVPHFFCRLCRWCGGSLATQPARSFPSASTCQATSSRGRCSASPPAGGVAVQGRPPPWNQLEYPSHRQYLDKLARASFDDVAATWMTIFFGARRRKVPTRRDFKHSCR